MFWVDITGEGIGADSWHEGVALGAHGLVAITQRGTSLGERIGQLVQRVASD